MLEPDLAPRLLAATELPADIVADLHDISARIASRATPMP
jgi:hypothetical protein